MMALFRLSRRSCIFLILFLIVNPLPGLLARGDTKLPRENEGNYRWTNRGCRAVFRAIYNNVKIDPGELLVAFSSTTVDPTEKELDTTIKKIVEFVRVNPDKVSGAASIVALLASVCLLYDSILLTHGIRLFFDRFEELQGQFNAFVNTKLPKIENLVIEIRTKIETGSVPGDKEFRRIESVLLLYHKEILDVLDKVRDLIEEAVVAEWNAKLTAAVTFTFAVAAGVATSPKVPIHGLVFNGARIATACVSTVAGVLSLKNAKDCQLAQREMRKFKEKLEALKGQVWDWMLEMKMH